MPKEDMDTYRLLVQLGQTTWEELGFTPPVTDGENDDTNKITADDYASLVRNDQDGTADDAIIDEDAEEEDDE